MALDQYINLSNKRFKEGFATYDDQVRLYPLAEVTDAVVDELNAELAKTPDDPELYLKKGIALSRASLHHQEAIALFSHGLMLNPFHALLYRWRGHKYINVRQFQQARADLELSSRLDPRNWDTWYHLGLANYLVQDFTRAEYAYRHCWNLTDSDDKRVAIADWLYMTLRRQGRAEDAADLLSFVTPATDAGPNDAYFRRLLLYRGELSPDDLLEGADTLDVNYVTLGYGMGNYFYYNGNEPRAIEIWRSVLEGKYWSAFGYVASEVELNRLGAL